MKRDQKTILFRAIGYSLLLSSICLFIFQVVGCVNVYYSYENEIGSYWELAEKSSTLKAKSEYIDKFVIALEESKHSEYNAVLYKTPTESFENNFKALLTLRDRLVNIQKLDERSFAYQTAIQQITQQEQKEARDMIGVFKGCYVLENFFLGWNWYGLLFVLSYMVLFFVSFYFIIKAENSLFYN